MNNNCMMALDEIALKYGTDKGSTVHNYTPHYETHFSSRREEKLKLLEIGIQKGYSLRMWKEYFPNAKILGLDIHDCKHVDEERITTVQGSQNDRALLQDLSTRQGAFDIIVDDGSHFSRDMRISFDTLFPLLNPGGTYVVEDLETCYRYPFRGLNAFMRRVKGLMDDVNQNRGAVQSIHLYESLVFIDKKKY